MSEVAMKTYKQRAADWWEELSKDGTAPLSLRAGGEKFAAFLDSFRDLTPELQVIAMLEAKKVDRACMEALIDEIGKERASEVLKPILMRFHKTK